MAATFVQKWYMEANSISGKTVPKFAVTVSEVLDVLMKLIAEMEGEDAVNIVIRNMDKYGDHLTPPTDVPHDALPKSRDYIFAAWAFAGGVWHQEFLTFKHQAILFTKDRVAAGADYLHFTSATNYCDAEGRFSESDEVAE